MNKKELERVVFKVGSEGFDYCFVDYSDFKDVKDKKFHELRKAFVNSYNELENYLKEECKQNDINYYDLLG